jgi:hypothetical protein
MTLTLIRVARFFLTQNTKNIPNDHSAMM